MHLSQRLRILPLMSGRGHGIYHVKQVGRDLSTCYNEVVPMCLAVPGRITELHDERGVPMARVDFGGIAREVCMAYLPEARPGEYVVVHVGFAISQLDEEEAARTLADLRQLGELSELEE